MPWTVPLLGWGTTVEHWRWKRRPFKIRVQWRVFIRREAPAALQSAPFLSSLTRYAEQVGWIDPVHLVEPGTPHRSHPTLTASDREAQLKLHVLFTSFLDYFRKFSSKSGDVLVSYKGRKMSLGKFKRLCANGSQNLREIINVHLPPQEMFRGSSCKRWQLPSSRSVVNSS